MDVSMIGEGIKEYGPYLILLIIIGLSLYRVLLIAIMKYKESLRIKKFSETILKGLKSKSLEKMNDVENIYKAIANPSSKDLSYQRALTRSLRVLYFDLVSENRNVVVDDPNDDLVKGWVKKISDFIHDSESMPPYVNLPDDEKQLVMDITALAEKLPEEQDTDSLKRKLSLLANVLLVRSDDIDRIRKVNKWSVPLSIVAMIATIALGILALIR